MDRFEVTMLGCGSAKPCISRNPACTVVNYRENLFMIDCGEGAQRSFQRQRLKFSRLGHIFLTHLHGDHVLGLPGLVSTLALSGKEGELVIHTFEEGKTILRKIFDFFARDITLNVSFNILNPKVSQTAFENASIEVVTVPLNHRVPAVGYIFREKPKPRHIIGEMVKFHGVPVAQMKAIKDGADFVKPDGAIIPNAMLTTDPTPSRSYAHISDTRYMPDLYKSIEGVDLLFHETTYLDDLKAEAKARYHTTALEAAHVAAEAKVGCLLMGHYSSRYRDTSVFEQEAQTIFPNSIAAYDGIRLEVGNQR